LFAQNALVIPEKIEELENVRLPSGKTIKAFYEAMLADMAEYWGNRGELVRKLSSL
jgi:hypothetical protein